MRKKLFIFFITILIISSYFIIQNKNNSRFSWAQLLFQEQNETLNAIDTAQESVVSVISSKELTTIIRNKETGKTKINSGREKITSGSGVIIDENGLILTNKHVITLKEKYSVILNNKEIYDAEILAKDPIRDIALIKISPPKNIKLKPIHFADSRKLKVGETVLAIGYPLGKYINSVSKGIISGLHRDLAVKGLNNEPIVLNNMIQTDAAINHGNSGGPLIDLNGNLIGLNTAIDAGEDLGFAIPSNELKKSIYSYKKYGKIIRPKLGVRFIMIDPMIAKFLGLPRKNGAWIHSGDGKPSILKNSPAEKSGLRDGDIIFEVNAIKVTEDLPLSEIINFYEPGQKIGFKVQRGNKILIIKTTLGKFEEEKN